MNALKDFINVLRKYPEAYHFIVKHKLWEGFGKYKIVGWAIIIVAVFLGLRFFQLFFMNSDGSESDGVIGMGLGSITKMKDLLKDSYDFLFVGGFRYVILFLLEVLIFHFALKTIEILSGRRYELTVHDFIHAQFRMLKIIVFNFGVEIVISIILAIILGIMGLEWMKAGLMFVVTCFLLGFVVMDNFNEIQGAGIRTSFKRTQEYIGAAIGIGLPLYFIMLIPVIGTVLGPIMAIVTASLFLYEEEPEVLHEDIFLEDNLV